MCEELLENPAFWNVLSVTVGVFLGFALAEGSRCLHRCIRNRRLIRLVREELISLRAQLPQKQDIFRQIIEALQNKSILPGSSVRTLRAGYENNLKNIYLLQTPRERNCLHVIYERVRIMDDELDSFEQSILMAITQKLIADPFAVYALRFGELVQSCKIIADLIESYLKGVPTDVFFQER